jgi:hypothetical protein
MRDELPALTPHPAGGDALAQQPQSLSLFRHGRTLSPSPTTCGTETAQADSIERGARAGGQNRRGIVGDDALYPLAP